MGFSAVRKVGLCVLVMLGLYWCSGGLWIIAKAQLAQVLIANAWQQTDSTAQHKPWPWADTWPVARLQVPKHQQDLYVLAGAQGHSLAFGPGHITGSALPGQRGFSVVGGHRDTHFRFLQQVKLGEEFLVKTKNGDETTYVVDAIEVVNVEQSALLRAPMQSESSKYLSLVTCYPFNAISPNTPLRLVVSLMAVNEADQSFITANPVVDPSSLRVSYVNKHII